MNVNVIHAVPYWNFCNYQNMGVPFRELPSNQTGIDKSVNKESE
jgi:hypothetical protein